MITEINEKIKVGAVFDGNNIKPKWFIWKNNKYEINETTYTWQTKQGEIPMLHFSVTNGATLFELSLNQKTLAWMLEKVSTE
ncbi:MAG: hypothetical protein A2539_01405 [Elusimicrobia bacterium RIFOXYD2_FULL_34_15]|nr:MAG: hypothetical protein A2539_01405 [Elusimicrobia bacterium RIFOXYD2_FULL_34_15]